MTKETERRRILVIDDNDSIHGDFRKTLDRRSSTERLAAAAAALFGDSKSDGPQPLSFEVESALQGKEGHEMVQKAIRDGRPYALAFVDMRMPPGWDGVETVQHLWEADPELQIVICTAYTDYSWDQIVEKLGATDRLLILKKPFDPIEVCQLATSLSEKWKLKRQAVLKLDQLEKMVHERTADLRRAALTDALTGLPNRASIHDHIKQAIAHAAAHPDSRFAAFFIDFDRFKVINDSQGHKVGDQLLASIADRLCVLLNQQRDNNDLAQAPCIAARLGGDEFVILQRGIRGNDQAVELAEKLIATLNDVYQLGENEVQTTASIGITTSDHAYQWSDEVLRDADSAMYRAKSMGKARYVVFNPEMRDETMRRLTLENDLRKAIDQKQFFLVYQPIVSLTDANLVGFEALLRWRHPQRGIVSPADFIYLAEETGAVVQIGQWVFNEAIHQFRDWVDRFPEAANLTMSINCSIKQLARGRFAKTVMEALGAGGMAPQQLNIEVTESIMMSNPEECRQTLEELRALGVKIHMDDFGTGYSSLNCLHTLPLNVLKIDRSFVHNVSQRRDYAAVIDAIVQLAHNLGMKVVAEGIETADHAAMLCALDCDYGQGYFFSKPLMAEDAAAFIQSKACVHKQASPDSQNQRALVAT
jgi:diguanylate cyclase (GGDEF)-like protein